MVNLYPFCHRLKSSSPATPSSLLLWASILLLANLCSCSTGKFTATSELLLQPLPQELGTDTAASELKLRPPLPSPGPFSSLLKCPPTAFISYVLPSVWSHLTCPVPLSIFKCSFDSVPPWVPFVSFLSSFFSWGLSPHLFPFSHPTCRCLLSIVIPFSPLTCPTHH